MKKINTIAAVLLVTIGILAATSFVYATQPDDWPWRWNSGQSVDFNLAHSGICPNMQQGGNVSLPPSWELFSGNTGVVANNGNPLAGGNELCASTVTYSAGLPQGAEYIPYIITSQNGTAKIRSKTITALKGAVSFSWTAYGDGDASDMYIRLLHPTTKHVICEAPITDSILVLNPGYWGPSYDQYNCSNDTAYAESCNSTSCSFIIELDDASTVHGLYYSTGLFWVNNYESAPYAFSGWFYNNCSYSTTCNSGEYCNVTDSQCWYLGDEIFNGNISGYAIRKDTGFVSGASIEFISIDGGSNYSTTSGLGGAYSITLNEGCYNIWAGENYSGVPLYANHKETNFCVYGGNQYDKNITFENWSINVSVKDSVNGSGIPGALVTIEPHIHSRPTDSNGILYALLPSEYDGTNYTIEVTRAGYAPIEHTFTLSAPRNVSLYLDRSGAADYPLEIYTRNIEDYTPINYSYVQIYKYRGAFGSGEWLGLAGFVQTNDTGYAVIMLAGSNASNNEYYKLTASKDGYEPYGPAYIRLYHADSIDVYMQTNQTNCRLNITTLVDGSYKAGSVRVYNKISNGSVMFNSIVTSNSTGNITNLPAFRCGSEIRIYNLNDIMLTYFPLSEWRTQEVVLTDFGNATYPHEFYLYKTNSSYGSTEPLSGGHIEIYYNISGDYEHIVGAEITNPYSLRIADGIKAKFVISHPAYGSQTQYETINKSYTNLHYYYFGELLPGQCEVSYYPKPMHLIPPFHEILFGDCVLDAYSCSPLLTKDERDNTHTIMLLMQARIESLTRNYSLTAPLTGELFKYYDLEVVAQFFIQCNDTYTITLLNNQYYEANPYTFTAQYSLQTVRQPMSLKQSGGGIFVTDTNTTVSELFDDTLGDIPSDYWKWLIWLALATPVIFIVMGNKAMLEGR